MDTCFPSQVSWVRVPSSALRETPAIPRTMRDCGHSRTRRALRCRPLKSARFGRRLVRNWYAVLAVTAAAGAFTSTASATVQPVCPLELERVEPTGYTYCGDRHAPTGTFTLEIGAGDGFREFTSVVRGFEDLLNALPRDLERSRHGRDRDAGSLSRPRLPPKLSPQRVGLRIGLSQALVEPLEPSQRLVRVSHTPAVRPWHGASYASGSCGKYPLHAGPIRGRLTAMLRVPEARFSPRDRRPGWDEPTLGARGDA